MGEGEGEGEGEVMMACSTCRTSASLRLGSKKYTEYLSCKGPTTWFPREGLGKTADLPGAGGLETKKGKLKK